MIDKNALAADQIATAMLASIETARRPFTQLPSAAYVEPRISIEEIGRRGEDMYIPLRSSIEAEHHGKFLSIDIETGEYAIGVTSRDAYNQILFRKPDALLYTLRIGYHTAGRS